MKKILSALMIFVLLPMFVSGCKNSQPPQTESLGQSSENKTETAPADFSKTDADMFSDRDLKQNYDQSSAAFITLDNESSSASLGSVKISGGNVTVTEEATYVISGTLDDGMLIVDAPQTAKIQLVLDNVNITSKTSAALYILGADKVFVTLKDGTQNTLANGGSFEAIDDNNIDSALFSKQDLTLNGSGTLTVTSPAGHGIVCKDDLVATGGSFVINCASHGIDANDSVRLANAGFDITAGKDAVHCENSDDSSLGFVYVSSGSIKASAEGDGISAGAYMQIGGGTFDIIAGGGSENAQKASSDSFGGFMGGKGPGGMRPDSMQPTASQTTEDATSMKGLKSASDMQITGGSFTINSADDSLHSDASLTIGGGEFRIASGDDAVHAEDTLTVTAGSIDISESYEGLEALHVSLQGGDIKLIASDDGLNAAGGTDSSGFTGGRDGMFGGGKAPGGMGGPNGMSANSNGSIKISGGTLYINSSGDGLDANGTLEISGGYTVVTGPTRGDTATLDYDKSATISGGTFIGTGASGMAQTFSDSAQGVIALSVGSQAELTPISVKKADGTEIINHSPELDFAVVIISSPELVKGEKYSVTVGSQSSEFEAN